VSARPLAAEYARSYYLSVNALDSALSVVARWKLESRSVVFAVARTMSAGRHCTQLSVVNVSVQSSLKRGLVEGFTNYALRNGKPEGIPINTGRLH